LVLLIAHSYNTPLKKLTRDRPTRVHKTRLFDQETRRSRDHDAIKPRDQEAMGPRDHASSMELKV